MIVYHENTHSREYIRKHIYHKSTGKLTIFPWFYKHFTLVVSLK